MANEALHNNGEKAKVSSAAVNDDDVKTICDVVRLLPANAVKDLLSAEVCYHCIFRLFGLHEHICSRPSLSTSVLGAVFQEVMELGVDDVGSNCTRKHEDFDGQQFPQQFSKKSKVFSKKSKVCPICWGILQFLYIGDNGVLVTKGCASDFAAAIAEAVMCECHQFDSFSLEVSLPPFVMENENAVWLYMENKYSSELWYQQLSTSERVCTKDVLKMSITDTLVTLLTSTMGQDLKGNNRCNKRRKTGTGEDSVTNQGSVDAGIESTNIHEGERIELLGIPELQVHGSDSLKLPLEEVSQPCCLAHHCYRTAMYIGGRYLKYSRNVSQTRWIIDDERMGEASIEEIIASNILPLCGGDSYKFHAAGREDIDVRMLGTGRPFLVEIQNARQVPSEELIKGIELKINSLEKNLVRVKNLKSLGNNGWALMREGEAEKQKQYAALVWICRPLDDVDLQTISSLKDMQILQKTPVRVLHRRSPLEREKIIHWMRIERIAGSSQYFLLHLCTQAGTYIKEFVHGDLGRTHPSVGSILRCRAEILQLDVTDVKMDCFLD